MNTNRSKKNFKSRFCLALFLWVAGVLIGVSLASFGDPVIDYTLYDLTSGQTSFLRLVMVTSLPYLLCVFAFAIQRFFLCYPLLLIIGICRGFSGMFLVNVLGSGAWVIRFGYLFSASFTSVLIWWLLLRFWISENRTRVKDIYLTAGLLFVTCILDFCAISPFATDLLKYI